MNTTDFYSFWRQICINQKTDYSRQHLKWIKKVNQSWRQERILVLGFRTTLMKSFDPLQMLTSVEKYRIWGEIKWGGDS